MASYLEVIPDIVKSIVDEVHPLRILIFGSAVRGEIGSHSDIDLLVVMPEGTHRRQTAQQLYRKLRGFRIPFDILVVKPTDLEKHKENIGLIYWQILREGKEVYVA